ncbi:uncharacterized protein EI90DRAFT_2908211 [Cantharellus anzutake]|uniref:uncharacterized protein n=1 Tax=Cantharellus anzutake TaxID=1750568 RepID=UPI0019077B14|nr:uncharacterized protein EI90DRAFT_2908211 [Cantharellus anzutake]KAF8338981.1 hypothetical protein EI90DRAFT_2908211 [Cantharellus anzutake]
MNSCEASLLEDAEWQRESLVRAPSLEPPLSEHGSLDSKKRREMDDETNQDIYGPSVFGGFGEYMARKRRKLQMQNAEILNNTQSPKPQIFKGTGVYINGRTEPPLQELRIMIMEHGGIFHAYLDRKSLVTHIIATELTPNKVKEYQHMKVVRPEWVTDSVREGTLQPWKNYVFRPGSELRTDGVSLLHRVPKQSTLTESPKKSVSGPREASITSLLEPLAWAGRAASVQSYALHNSNIFASKLMEDPKWRLENTAAGPNFVENYFTHSRLHHLSTWKSELKLFVNRARDRLGSLSKLEDAPSPSPRVIMHCDFDSFFVAAGLVDRPEFRGKPVVVCHSNTPDLTRPSSTSEVASASYEARNFGVKNGMSLGQAKRLCPDIQPIPYEFQRYKEFSLQFYDILLPFADDIEVVSVDEALIDVTTEVQRMHRELGEGSHDAAEVLADEIRSRVRKATNCEVSVGIGGNVLLAKLANRQAKPAGTFHLLEEHAISHIDPLPIDRLPGFASSAKQKIEAKWGINTCGEVRKLGGVEVLQKVLGPGNGEKLWKYIRGMDDRGLKFEEPRKSLSAAVTYGVRFQTNEEVKSFLYSLAREVERRLEAESCSGQSLNMEIMIRSPDAPVEAPKFLGHGKCNTYHYRTTIHSSDGQPTSDANIIGAAAWKLFLAHHCGDTTDLRGVGFTIQKLERKNEDADARQRKLSFRNQGSAPGKSQINSLSPKAPLPQISVTDFADTSLIESGEDSIRSGTSLPVLKGSSFQKPSSKVNVRFITKQLAPPRSKLGSSGTYNIFKKKLELPLTFSDTELRDLDIDPSTFHALPHDIQREQLMHQRMLHRTWNLGSRDSRSRSRSRSMSVIPPKPSLLIAHELVVPSLKKAKTTEEIQDLISQWVDRYSDHGPEPEATATFQEFLSRCLSDSAGGSLGLEKVSSIMRWWLHLCRSKWCEDEVRYKIGSPTTSFPGIQWWSAFYQVRDNLNNVISNKYGGKLSLK